MFSAAQTWTPGWLRQSWEFQRRWSLSTSGCPLCKRSPSIFLGDQVEKPASQRFYNYGKYMRINRWKPGVSLTQASWVLPPGCSLTAHHHRPICHCWLWHWTLPLSLLKLKILISDSVILRFGWFIPSDDLSAPTRTHWRQFSNPQLIKPFLLSDEQSRSVWLESILR